MAAKLPESLIRQPERELRDLSIGETVFVRGSEMEVAVDSSCYLRPQSKIKLEPNIFFCLRVNRDPDGYHVTVLANRTWRLDADERVIKDSIPVASISIDYDPDSGPLENLA